MATRTLFSYSLTTDSDGNNGYTYVQVLPASILTLPGEAIKKIRVTFQGGSSQACTFSNAYLQYQGAGDAYDFSTTPLQLLFGGGASGVASAGNSVTSDWLDFEYNKTGVIVIAFYNGGGTSSDMFKYATSVTGTTNYYKAANDAATVNKSGYSTSANLLAAINKIEVMTVDGGVAVTMISEFGMM